MSIDEIGHVLVSYQGLENHSNCINDSECANESSHCFRLSGIRIWPRAIQNGNNMWKGLNLKLNLRRPNFQQLINIANYLSVNQIKTMLSI